MKYRIKLRKNVLLCKKILDETEMTWKQKQRKKII